MNNIIDIIKALITVAKGKGSPSLFIISFLDVNKPNIILIILLY
jgi:hypothetical protein